MHSRKQSMVWRMVFTLIILVFSGCAIVSCDNNRYYEQSEPIKNSIWYFKDTKVFNVEIKDSMLAFNFYINVRNTVDYEYANLYFFIQSKMPDGKFAQDTVECQLANYEGKWLGSGRGAIRYNNFILRKNMRFKQNGTYRLLLQHGMRNDSLKGIADVGIRLEKIK